MSRYLAFTRRDADHPDGPLGHAESGRRLGGPRSNMAALCGASVGRLQNATFDPDHPRACPKCRRIIRERERSW
ncbi:hypothetical protein [Miltoncostaea marina]|uniref:hypothetical protein n=1 Tax=Miltoncostaea marina TaxID=2843215 RepID=UPI001C3DAA70|nr:hypothetical protein [Miltoncostaea marina]